MFWKLYNKFRGVKGLKSIIDGNSIFVPANRGISEFLKVYFDRPFDSSVKKPFLIFDFLVDFIDEEKDYKLCESLMIGSKYFYLKW